jgi:hypothetical protein
MQGAREIKCVGVATYMMIEERKLFSFNVQLHVINGPIGPQEESLRST